MTNKEFKSILIENGIDYIKIVRTPDFRGGYNPIVYFNEEAKNYKLQEFEYVEFEGDVDKATENRNMVFESVYDQGVRMVNYPSLAQLVEERIYEHEQCSYTPLKKPYYNTTALASLASPLSYPRCQTIANHIIRHQPTWVVQGWLIPTAHTLQHTKLLRYD